MLGSILGPSWGQVGPKLGRLGRILGHVRPHWGPLGGPGRGPGRNPEADSGLGGTVFEPTCGKKATCQKLQKTIEKQCFSMIFAGRGLRGSVLSWFVHGKAVRMQGDKGYRRKEIDHLRKPKQFHNPNGLCQPTLLPKSWSTVRFVR